MLPVVVIAVFMCAGIVFLLWCLAHFIQEGLPFKKPTVTVMKIATDRAQNRKVFSIRAGACSRTRVVVGTRVSDAINAATEYHQHVIRFNTRFRKSL